MTEPRPTAARLAEEWSARVSKAARNLTDFNESDEARRVRARLSDGSAPYAGRTLTQARRAVSAIQSLWQDFLALTQVVDEAVALSRRSSFLSNHDDEVRKLLEGQSVRLRTVSIPVSQRGLLDAPETEERITPREALDSMRAVFSVARDAIAAIAAAEDALAPRVESLRTRAEAAAAWLSAAGQSAGEGAPSLPPASLLDGLGADPLAGTVRLDAVEAEIAAVEARRAEADRAAAALRARIEAGARDLDGLRQARSGLSAALEAARRVDGFDPGPLPQDGTGALDDWLGRLRRFAAEGAVRSAGIGMGKWEAALRAERDAVDASAGRARGAAAEVEDLRGLLGALRAKGAALAARPGGADPEAAEAEARAKAALRAEPVRLAAARASVKAYEAALARAGGRTGGRP